MKKRFFAAMLLIMMLIASFPVEIFAAGTPAPAKVSGFKKISSKGSIILKWKKVKGATGYLITWEKLNGDKRKGSFKKGANVTKAAISAGMESQFKFTIKAYKDYKVNGKTKRVYSAKAAVIAKARPVRRMKFRLVFREGKTLYARNPKTGNKIGGSKYFKAGTKVTGSRFDEGAFWFKYNGKNYRVLEFRVNSKIKTYSSTCNYTNAEAESFINKVGVTSGTKYLIWVNTYSQRLYIFKRSNGKWVYNRGHWLVSTGGPSTPTHYGKNTIVQKDSSNDGIPYWSVGGRGLYSIHGKLSSWDLGYPRSHGCVRNTNAHAEWIYDNCKIGTAIYVF